MLGSTDATGGWIIPNALVDDSVKLALQQNIYRDLCNGPQGVSSGARKPRWQHDPAWAGRATRTVQIEGGSNGSRRRQQNCIELSTRGGRRASRASCGPEIGSHRYGQ